MYVCVCVCVCVCVLGDDLYFLYKFFSVAPFRIVSIYKKNNSC